MYILGIESTCDETAAAVVQNGSIILSNVIFSQSVLHAGYGGVYPEVASRAHIEALIPVIHQAIIEAGITKKDLGGIAVAYAPGLIGGLVLGLEGAKALSIALQIPFIGVHHIEAHLYAAMMGQQELHFPALGVVLSGGHTLLIKINKIGDYQVLGTTLDDAIGEAFDKLAVMLGYPYPGGPMIEELASLGTARHKLNPGKMKERPFDFSYSGLKTACRLLIEKEPILSDTFKHDVAASFQEGVFKDLSQKIKKACSAHQLTQIYLGGGVVCNKRLRDVLTETLDETNLRFAPKALCSDNAAMIAGLGYHRLNLQGRSDPLDLTPLARTLLF